MRYVTHPSNDQATLIYGDLFIYESGGQFNLSGASGQDQYSNHLGTIIHNGILYLFIQLDNDYIFVFQLGTDGVSQQVFLFNSISLNNSLGHNGCGSNTFYDSGLNKFGLCLPNSSEIATFETDFSSGTIGNFSGPSIYGTGYSTGSEYYRMPWFGDLYKTNSTLDGWTQVMSGISNYSGGSAVGLIHYTTDKFIMLGDITDNGDLKVRIYTISNNTYEDIVTVAGRGEFPNSNATVYHRSSNILYIRNSSGEGGGSDMIKVDITNKTYEINSMNYSGFSKKLTNFKNELYSGIGNYRQAF